jgi:hypothetical protein
VRTLLDRSQQERADFRVDLEGTSGFFTDQIKQIHERADRSFTLHEQAFRQQREHTEQLMGVVLAVASSPGGVPPMTAPVEFGPPQEPQPMSDLDELNIERSAAGLPPLADLQETDGEAAERTGAEIPVDLLAGSLAGPGVGNGAGFRR